MIDSGSRPTSAASTRPPAPGVDRSRRLRRCWRRRWPSIWPDHAPRVLPRGRRRRLRDVRQGAERHPDRDHRGEDRAGRGIPQEDDPRARPGAVHLRDRRHRRLVGGVHPQRRADGRRGQGPAHGAPRAARRRSTSTCVRDRAGQGPAVPRPGLRLRRRRHDPRRHERGQVDADQHPRHRQEPEAGAGGRRADPRAGAPGSTAWSTPGSSSGSTTPSTSSTSTAPRPPTSA